MRDLREELDKPLLFVDIDGVISLFGFPPAAPPAGTWTSVDGVPHLISAAVPGHLLALARAFDLVWCSGWEEKADEHLPHALGLPAGLPHLGFAGSSDNNGRHWKLAAIDTYARTAAPVERAVELLVLVAAVDPD